MGFARGNLSTLRRHSGRSDKRRAQALSGDGACVDEQSRLRFVALDVVAINSTPTDKRPIPNVTFGGFSAGATNPYCQLEVFTSRQLYESKQTRTRLQACRCH